jgi:cytochrome c556
MIKQKFAVSLFGATLLTASFAFAADDPRHVRHELMEGVRDAAKVVGGMLKGDVAYDQAAAMESLAVFQDASSQFGDLFPAGTESGDGTRAAAAIWDDRAGFEEAIAAWQMAIGSAIEAKPGTLEEARPVIGKVMQGCKGCHDNYRTEEE